MRLTEDQNKSPDPDDGAGVLDVIVVLAEGWKPLVLMPFVAGLLAYFAYGLFPREYEAMLTVAASSPAAIVSDQYLDAAVRQVEGEAAKSDPAQARTDLRNRISTSPNGQFGTTIAVRDSDPDSAARWASAVGSAAIAQQAGLASQMIETYQAAISSLARTQDILAESLKGLNAQGDPEAVTRAIAVVAGEMAQLRLQLDVLQSTSTVSAPTIRSLGPSRLTIVTFTTTLTAVIVLTVLFLKAATARAASSPLGQVKLQRIRKAFTLIPRRP